MRQLMTLVLTLFLGTSAFANDPEFAFAVGFRNTNVDPKGGMTSSEAGNGIQVGMLGFLPFNEVWGLRSGFLYSQRKYLVSNGTVDTEVNTAWLDIPATVMVRFNEYGGVFGGIVLALNQAKDCSQSDGSPCNIQGLTSSVMPLTFGVSFKFAPQMGAEFYYEHLSGKVSDDSENQRSIGANFAYYFE